MKAIVCNTHCFYNIRCNCKKSPANSLDLNKNIYGQWQGFFREEKFNRILGSVLGNIRSIKYTFWKWHTREEWMKGWMVVYLWLARMTRPPRLHFRWSPSWRSWRARIGCDTSGRGRRQKTPHHSCNTLEINKKMYSVGQKETSKYFQSRDKNLMGQN